jgi:hypothetical protein
MMTHTQKFEYTKGPAHTTKPWYRPDGSLLNLWKEEFFRIPGTQNYKFWVCGGVLEQWDTWDTDIVAQGKIESYEELENILVKATQLGLDLKQLIDINWNDSLANYFERTTTHLTSPGPGLDGDIISIRPKNISSTGGTLTLDSPPMDYDMVAIGRTWTKNGKSHTRRHPHPEKLSNFLWKFPGGMGYNVFPSLKQKEKMENGRTYRRPPIELREDFDFTTVVNTPLPEKAGITNYV